MIKGYQETKKEKYVISGQECMSEMWPMTEYAGYRNGCIKATGESIIISAN